MRMKNASYRAGEEYLDSFINYEKEVRYSYAGALNLERIKRFLGAAGISYQKLKVIHIAGTKGKGSTAAFCADLLAHSGYKVGLYTSPHFFDFRERIVVKSRGARGDGERRGTKDEGRRTRDVGAQYFAPDTKKVESRMISRNEVVRIVGKFKPHLEKFRFRKKLGKLTFFEIYTAIAFKHFLDKGVDFAVLETGLGGRLDATNVVNSSACIITHIGYDHAKQLGTRLGDVAYEKAGIIKQGVPLVCAPQKPASLKVIKNKCKKEKSPFFLFGENFLAQNIKLKKDHTLFDYKFGKLKLNNLRIRLKGKHQVENASCALAAVQLLKNTGVIEDKIDFKGGIRNCSLRGRFEIAERKPLVIIDIAHNASSFLALRNNLKTYFPSKKIILIFACSRDKDAKKMLREIDYSCLILTRFNNPRSYDPREIKEVCNLKPTAITNNVEEAINAAKKIFRKDTVIVVSGSSFLAGEAKKIVNQRKSGDWRYVL